MPAKEVELCLVNIILSLVIRPPMDAQCQYIVMLVIALIMSSLSL